jgi:uncharacterized membrane-anchored protein
MNRTSRTVPAVLLLALLAAPLALAQDEPPAQDAPPKEDQAQSPQAAVLASVAWKSGPAKVDIGTMAEIELLPEYVFAGGDDTRRLMEMMNNLPTHREQGFVAPASLDWFVVFEWDDSGYVKDDEKDELDAEGMLDALRRGQERANVELKRRGWATLTVEGWEQPPKYDAETHNLEWAPRLRSSSGGASINYNTRLLGRRGVMEVVLVVGPEKLQDTLPLFKALLKTYAFKSGERYAEYREGDKLAQYGLTALVTGGAVAVAAKTGLLATLAKFFAKLGKGIVLVVIAVLAALKAAAGRLFGRKHGPASEYEPPASDS